MEAGCGGGVTHALFLSTVIYKETNPRVPGYTPYLAS